MPDNESTLPKRPRPKTPDNYLLDTTDNSSRPEILTIQLPGIGKILATVPVGAELVIGRFETSDIGPLCLNLSPFKAIDQGVSRRHAKIKHTDSGWLIEDSGSSNGTWLDGERLVPFEPCLIRTNSHLLLAQLECYVILPTGRAITRKLVTP